MSDDASRQRKVRGERIQTSRAEKRRRKGDSSRSQQREQKQLDRLAGDDGAGAASAQGGGTPPADVDPGDVAGPFVETDEVRSYRDRIERWLDADQPVHLIGPTGAGKTSLAMRVASERDRPVVWITGDEALSTADLVGEHAGKEQYAVRDEYVRNVVKKKSVVRDRWVDNPLTIAVREGATLVYNEFSRTKPAANNALLSVFEESVLSRPGKRGEDARIDVHPEFRALLVSNSTEHAGVHRPQDALLDRLVAVHMDFYGPETETEIVAAHVDDLDRDRIEEVVGVVQTLRDELDVTVGTRAAVTTARGLGAFGDEASLAEVAADVVGSKVATRAEFLEVREQIESIL